MMYTYQIKSPTRISFDHPEAGQIYVIKHIDHPASLPWFCDGRYYSTPENAEVDFDRRWHASKNAVSANSSPPFDAATATGMYDQDF